MMPAPCRAIYLAFCLPLAACAGPSRAPGPGSASGPQPVVRDLASPAAPGSRGPSLAPAPDGGVLLSWVEAGAEGVHVLKFTSRPPGGAWSPPHVVAEGRDWFVNWADVPSLAALPDGTLVAHWLVKDGPGAYDYQVRLSRSTDAGSSWSPPLVPHAPSRGEHGFVSLLPWPDGRLEVVWLDGRSLAEGRGATALMSTTLSAGFEPGPEAVLDARACDCCQTAAARSGDAMVVVYRDRSPDELRDISSVRFAGGAWGPSQPLSRDGWQIKGCPVNGPSVSAEGDNVAVAWFTAAGDAPVVRVALSQDGGRGYGAPVTLSEGRPLGRVDVVALPEGGAFVSFLEGLSDGAELRVRRVGADGTPAAAVRVAGSSQARRSGFPRMERSGRELVLAWTSPAEPPQVLTAVLAF